MAGLVPAIHAASDRKKGVDHRVKPGDDNDRQKKKSSMIWLLVTAFCAVVVLLIALYRRAMHDTEHMFSLLILVLLDDGVYATRKSDLLNFIRATKSRNASQLSTEVYNSLCGVANRIAGTSVLGAHAGLWKIKVEQ